MEQTLLHILKELINILRDGGPYAGWALFILLWYFERRENKILRKEGTYLAVTQVENNVKTEMTLISLKEALNGVIHSLRDLTTVLNKIQTMKESLLQLYSKPDLKLLDGKTKEDETEE